MVINELALEIFLWVVILGLLSMLVWAATQIMTNVDEEEARVRRVQLMLLDTIPDKQLEEDGWMDTKKAIKQELEKGK